MKRTLLRMAVLVSVISVGVLAYWRMPERGGPPNASIGEQREEAEKIPSALERKLARLTRLAPSSFTDALDDPQSFADQDWIEHTTDGEGNGPVDFATLTSSRNDFAAHRRRAALGTAAWVPLGPLNGINDMNNAFRDRSVYNAGTENFRAARCMR